MRGFRKRGGGIWIVFLMVVLSGCMTGSRPGSSQEGHWWETGLSPDYPRSTYLTASGFGSSVNRARNDALKNLSQTLRAKVQSRTILLRNRTDASLSVHDEEKLSVRTDEVLRNVFYPKVRFFPRQNGYYALAVLNRQKEAMALMSEVNHLKLQVLTLREQMTGVSDPIQQIRFLKKMVSLGIEARRKDAERAALGGGSMLMSNGLERDRSNLQHLMNQFLTYSVQFGGNRKEGSSLKGDLLKSLSRKGFRQVPVGGRIAFHGKVRSRLLPPEPGSPYLILAFHADLSVVNPANGQVIWSEQDIGRVRGLDPSQARMLLEERLKRRLVRPAVHRLEDYLFHPGKSSSGG
ncbi:MAG: LPP20 family lipoprotein [Leptospirales bacterium]